MAQRSEAKNSLDDFPTPPWATRALFAHGIPQKFMTGNMTCLEPAAGRGHMSKVLWEYFSDVHSSDIFDYGFGSRADFLSGLYQNNSFDWVVTNPPFRLAESFIQTALTVARVGVAVLVRTVFVESVGRYERLFKPHPPLLMAQFTERVPMVKGRLDKRASTATGYCWVLWVHGHKRGTKLVWIPACRKALETGYDYELPAPRQSKYSIQNPVAKKRIKSRKIVSSGRQEDLFGADK